MAQDLAIQVEQAALQRQYESLRAMSLEDFQYSSLGPISVVRGDAKRVLPADALKLKEGDSGATILRLLRDLLLANGDETVTVKEARLDEYPRVSIGSYRFLQSIRGIPVINGGVAVEYDGKTKRITSLAAGFIPNRELLRTPKLAAHQADQIAGGEVIEPTYPGYLLPCCGPRPPKLVWAIKIWSNDIEMVYVDAISGVVVARLNMSSS